MIVLSVGMPRAGSGWHYNLIHDLMKVSGYAEAREIRTRFHLEKILTEVNCNIGVLSARRLGMVMVPALLGSSFVIKAHSAPTPAVRTLTGLGLMRITYIYRDPRDAMLSAYDYGRRALDRGRPNAFSHLRDFDESLSFMAEYVRIWEAWMREKKVLIARYEDLLTNYEAELERLLGFLHVDGSRPEVRAVVEQYRPGRAEGQQGLHFFKGRIGRFREAYSEQQQRALIERFGACLTRMGYEI